LQNLAPWLTDTPQAGQESSNFVPHCSQNSASALFSVRHFEQSITLPQARREGLGFLRMRCQSVGESAVDFGKHPRRK
jgi:hypothetical protein